MTFPRALARYTRGAINNMTLHLAGHAAFADLEHVGRKSGIVRHTPVRAFRARDTVIIGLNFGRRSDWYQNIAAAGTCRIRLGGEQFTLGTPALVPTGQIAKDIPWLFSFALRHVVRTAECVQLPILLVESRVRVLRCAMLEGQDGGVLDGASADLDGPPDGLIGVPRAWTAEHGLQVRQQGLADFPGGGVP
jgi:deazaflavin-dependent oxidoreductase (nitroreductase family)